MSNKLFTQVMLPYKYTRGSVPQRQQKANQMVDKLYKNLKGRFKNGELELGKVQESIDEILPSRVRVIVKSSTNDVDFDGYSDIGYSPYSGKIIYTTIEMPSENHKIKLKDLPSVLHEFQHITDQLFHPKYLVRNQDMTNNLLYTKKYDKLYDEFIYNYEQPDGKADKRYILKRLEHKIKKFLRKMPVQERIDYLQDSRYCLIMEKNGYFTQQKYAKKMHKQHLDVNPLDLKKLNKDYMFEEKINLLKKIAGSIIKKERTRLKLFLKHDEALRNVKSDNK